MSNYFLNYNHKRLKQEMGWKDVIGLICILTGLILAILLII